MSVSSFLHPFFFCSPGKRRVQTTMPCVDLLGECGRPKVKKNIAGEFLDEWTRQAKLEFIALKWRVLKSPRPLPNPAERGRGEIIPLSPPPPLPQPMPLPPTSSKACCFTLTAVSPTHHLRPSKQASRGGFCSSSSSSSPCGEWRNSFLLLPHYPLLPFKLFWRPGRKKNGKKSNHLQAALEES